MSRKLVIATIAGLAVCGASLGAAILVGGDDIFHDPRSLGEIKPLIDLATQKTWHWNGGDTLALDAPINIRYQAEGKPQVSITGPAEAVRHVQVSEGRIGTDNSLSRKNGRNVEAVVSGIAIRKFVVNGGEHLDLGTVKQPNLDLHINGNGTVSGSGDVERLNLILAGPGKADLGGLSVRDNARVAILGNGEASLAPRGDLRLFIAGNGKLNMTTKPRNISQTILGNGEVQQLTGAALEEVREEAREAAREAAQEAREALKNLPSPPMPPMPPMPMSGGVTQTDDSVTVRNSRDVDLGRIEQQRLKVTVLASGSVTAVGKVDLLQVQVMGSGEANLGRLNARRVEVTIAGSGDVTTAPGDELKVHIMGSGDVHLTTRPARVQQTILGSGKIINPER